MLNRHHDAYEKKFVEHGLKVLHKEVFNGERSTKEIGLLPCHAWILSPKQEEETEADAEGSYVNYEYNSDDYRHMGVEKTWQD